MDVFDMKSGSLYAVLAIASSVYLLRGFSFHVRPLLKALLAIQLLGDLLFFNWLLNMPVYSFIKSLTAQDRIYPLLMLMACVLCMDAGAAVLAARRRARRSGPHSVPLRGVGLVRTNRQNDVLLKLDATMARRVGTMFVILAFGTKVMELFFSGILNEPSLVMGILSWQPEMSAGFTFLGSLGMILLPIGMALLVMKSRKKRHWIAMAFMFGFGFLSPWKGDVVRVMILYGFAISQFGGPELRRMVLSKGSRIIFVAILLFLPLKAQFRAGQESGLSRDWRDPDLLVEDFVGAVGARAMGGVFQSYVYVVNSLERGYPTMGGRYNVQALYLWVPRLLWPNKPDIAGEQVYYYLELTKARDEPYGTSFATTVFGTFMLDFGFWGSLFCSFLLGGLINLGDRFIGGLANSRNDVVKVYSVAFTVLWLNVTFSLSEGGVPPAFTVLLLGTAIFVATSFPLWTMRSGSKKTPAATLGAQRSHLAGGAASRIVP
jgi:hypothetical protein